MAKSSTGGRLRAALFLLLSTFAALIAAIVIYTVIRNFQDQLREVSVKPDLETVIVAKRTLWPGETITDEDLDMREYPPDFIPEDVLATRDLAINRVPLERILQDEFIRKERLAPPDAGRGLPAIVPRGMRAISLNISGGSAVAGFLNPGNYVDVLVTAGDPLQTKTLFQAVTVLAVNDRLGANEIVTDEDGKREGQRKPKGAPSVTVAVTPDQAEKVTHAYTQGTVTLTLRNDIDVTNVEEHDPVFVSNLIGHGPSDDSAPRSRRYDRISIAEYNKRQSESADGTLILIKGATKDRQNVPNR